MKNLQSVSSEDIVQILGRWAYDASDRFGEDQYIARAILRDLRKAIGLDESARVYWNGSSYDVATSKKALARLARKENR